MNCDYVHYINEYKPIPKLSVRQYNMKQILKLYMYPTWPHKSLSSAKWV